MAEPVSVDALGGAIKAAIGPAATVPTGLLEIPAPLGKRLGVHLASDMKGSINKGTSPDGKPFVLIKPRPQGGTKPLLNTGKFRNTIVGKAEPHGASAGTNAIQANLMNAGGVVRAKKGKMLAIPLTREAVRADGPLRFPRKLTLIKSKKGKILLVEAQQKTKTGKLKKRKTNSSEDAIAANAGAGHGLIAQYWLTPSVTIPARPFNGFTPQAVDDATQMVIEYMFGGKA